MCIIADASPLIGLAKIDRLELLKSLFKSVIIPKEVADECTEHHSKPGAILIARAIQSAIIDVYSETISPIIELNSVLGKGEAAAIALAKQLSSPLLIDDRRGRYFAKKLGVSITGLPGVLLLAKRNKIIHAVEPILNELHAYHYHLSKQLHHEVLRLAGEK